ncbi:hypothetical protein AGMMS49975_08800 [Clostridia bacterium]|nr:hypothetical protein AGMMS49975_08800 [Clostridia bacterium]
MPEWFVGFAALIALGGGIFGAINGYRTMKRTSPIEEIKKEVHDKWKSFYADKWDKTIERIENIEETVRHVDSERTQTKFRDIDAKLDNDNRRIESLVNITRSQQKMIVLVLKSQMLMIQHATDGNHVDKMKDIEREIQDFLLNEVTRCEL